MTTATTIRRLKTEARQQHRMKARLAAWWSAERCQIFPPLPALASLSDLLSIIEANKQDDTPTPMEH